MKFTPDVYAGMIPCIANGTAVHDPNDPCHTSRPATAAAVRSSSKKGVVLDAEAAKRVTPGRIQFICFG
jgi:hypothetical protein